MNIMPTGDKILVKVMKEENISPGGITLLGNKEGESRKGKVISTGPGVVNSHGKRDRMSTKAGDVVFFGNHVGAQVDSSDGELLVIRECFILGVLECQS